MGESVQDAVQSTVTGQRRVQVDKRTQPIPHKHHSRV